MESNKVNVVTLLARLGGTERELVSVDKFVDFLKAKVDKRRDASELYGYALQMDVDNDGCISADDLKTCLENSNFHGFYEQSANELDNGEITDSKIIAVLECIRKVMRTRKILCAELFKTCDTEKVGFINKAQFVRGISSVVKIASPLLEKMFLIMDSNKIGMVDYEKFEVLIKAMAPSQIPRTSVVEDSFSWQEQII
jgi:Ca2+-binding EF-hand superfamily protein